MKDNEIAVKKYNESIAPRAKSIVAWFKNPEWTEGVRPYYSYLLETYRDELEKPGTTNEFTKGQISVLKEILNFPSFIERQVEMSEKPQPHPQGDAGY